MINDRRPPESSCQGDFVARLESPIAKAGPLRQLVSVVNKEAGGSTGRSRIVQKSLFLLALGDEACGQPSHVAFAEEKSEHVLFHDLDGLRVRGAEAVFIHNHGEPFQPPFPALFGYVLVDPLAQRPGVGRAIETFRLALENLTIDSTRQFDVRRGFSGSI